MLTRRCELEGKIVNSHQFGLTKDLSIKHLWDQCLHTWLNVQYTATHESLESQNTIEPSHTKHALSLPIKDSINIWWIYHQKKNQHLMLIVLRP